MYTKNNLAKRENGPVEVGTDIRKMIRAHPLRMTGKECQCHLKMWSNYYIDETYKGDKLAGCMLNTPSNTAYLDTTVF